MTVTIDSILAVATVPVAYYLRLGYWTPLAGIQWLPVALALLAVPIFFSFGLYRTIIRYAGLPTILAAAQASLIYGALYAVILTVIGFDTIPRTLGFIQPILFFLSVVTSRLAARQLLHTPVSVPTASSSGRSRVLIYGAGSAGRQLAGAIANGVEMRVAGYVDDDGGLQGATLNGLRIYSAENLPRLIKDLEVDEVLLAIPSASRHRRLQVLEMLRAASVTVRTLPGMMEIASGTVEVADIRELDVEDLLGRPAVAASSPELQSMIADQTVMITGAGGSIGSELCRRVLDLEPRRLLLLEHSEFALYVVHEELLARSRSGRVNSEIVPLLGSVTDANRVGTIISTWQPTTIYHAAAYKHVPIVEHNPIEGIRNNVVGSLVVAQAAIRNRVKNFILISTDKAVRPTNIMGASKRFAEMILQALAAEQPGATCLSMVRFGNVLGSSGSVVPLFRRQIRYGGPVTVTDPDITRYFMTIPEAVQLVMHAGAMASGGEVFVLDMGNPVRIWDLAKRMIELSGMKLKDDVNPDGDIEIAVIGLRPGEKLYEELLIGNDPATTCHPRILKAREPFASWPDLQRFIAALQDAVTRNDGASARSILRAAVSDFQPNSAYVDWSHLHRSRADAKTVNPTDEMSD